MTLEKRLLIISEIAFEHSNMGCDDGYWIIGMLCDLSLSEDKLNQEIEEIKQNYPSLAKYFNKYMNYANFFELKGQIIESITGLTEGNDEVVITTNIGKYRLYHLQDCCEEVLINKVIGNVSDLVGEVIFAEEDAGANDPGWFNEKFYDSHTWTKYVLKTDNASLEFWFLGTSNGYYGEDVIFVKI